MALASDVEIQKSLDQIETRQNVPVIQAPFRSVLIDSLSDINYLDRDYYDHSQFDTKVSDKNIHSKYLHKEAQYISRMNGVLKEGNSLKLTLYAFRSTGKAIPHVQSQDQENKMLVYEKTCEVLKPEIYRMITLMDFRDKLVSAFSESLTAIIPDMKDRELFPSEAFLLALAELFDLTVSLDTMKNFKGSMTNDLSMYKRSKSMLTKDPSDPELMVLPKLSFFLATKDQFANDVKKSLSSMNNTYEEIICDMINLCADHLEKGSFLLPQRKHIYLRAMAFAIWLIDGDGDEMDFSKKKKFKVERIAKIFKATPIVPLFGDIAMNVGSILVKAPHWNSQKYDINNMDPEYKAEMKEAYLLRYHYQQAQEQYLVLMNNLQKRKMQITHYRTLLGVEDIKSIYNEVYFAIKSLSDLTNSVFEQAAWKYLNPCEAAKDDETTGIYENAVQFNYDAEEKKALLLYITMIKDLQGILLGLEPIVKQIISTHIQTTVQTFTKGPINEYYNAAVKKKKPTVSFLKSVKDYILEAESDVTANPNKFDPISMSQFYFVRSILDLSFNEKAKGMKGGMMKEKNFKESQVAELEKFFNESLQFPLMMDLSDTIRKCSDLSNLWFKEFYLELTKQVQFPTKTSLPWILTEFVLDSQDSTLLQNVFIPLDLYNDAAYTTLYSLKSRYIYDEIEAEVNLCFDQFMFKLGKNVYRHYKKLASLKHMESDIKLVIPATKSLWNAEGLVPDAFENILKQKDVKLLGRSVDLTKILSVTINQYTRHSIDAAITRFEASDLTNVLELETLLDISKKTHVMLSKYIELEPFEDLLKEVDESVGIVEYNGRIVSHIVHEAVNELIPNYCYNNVTNRFLKGTVFYAEPVQRSAIPNAKPMYLYGTKALSIEYTMKHGFFKDYIGEVHFNSLVRTLGAEGLAVVSTEISNHVKLIVEHTMAKFLQIINDATNFPIAFPDSNNFTESYDQLCFKYSELSKHKSLKSEILQAFREIGNAIMAMKCFEDQFMLENAKDKLLVQEIQSYDEESSGFIGHFSGLEKEETAEAVPSNITLKEVVSAIRGNIRSNSKKALLFRYVLKTISIGLRNIPEFKEVENCFEKPSFAKTWTALQFVASIPSVSGERTIRELFGDGLPIAGVSIMYIYKQAPLSLILDINRHLLKLFKSDNNDKNSTERADIKQFIKNAKWFDKMYEECIDMVSSV